MDNSKLIKHIVKWLSSYSKSSNTKGFVIGVSGGIDSAVTSTLCCKTGLPTICIEIPIHQSKKELDRSKNHINWLKNNYSNIESKYIDLTNSFEEIKKSLVEKSNNQNNLALANSRSRLRMLTLYYYAAINNFLVVGTGNKVEDFGVGFYTKYGDGGVDISPIADLMKSEVRSIGLEMSINNEIIIADPTDGLWDDTRTDENQIGASYDELEWAMIELNKGKKSSNFHGRKKEVFDVLLKFNLANNHKMVPIPICEIPQNIKS